MEILYFILITIIFIAFAGVAWRDLKLALVLLAGLLPTYLLRFSLGPLPSTVLEGLILICTIVWIVKHQGFRRLKLTSKRPWLSPLLLMIAAASFGVTVAVDSITALGIWKAYFIEPLLIYFMLRDQLRTRADWRWLLRSLGTSAIVLSVLGLAQYLTGLGLPAPWDLERRITSVFDYPNALGLYLAPIIAIGFVSLVKTQAKERIFWLVVIVSGLAAIVLAKTEAAFVAIPAALLVTLLISGAKPRLKYRALAEVILIAAIIFFAFPNVQSKLLLRDYSGEVRRAGWSETIELVADNPILGVGLSGYPTALAPYHDPKLYEIFQYPHNIILNIWVELGLLGLLAFAWLAALTLKTARDYNRDPLVLAAFAALCVMVIHGLVDVPFFKNDLSVLTLMLITILSVAPKLKTNNTGRSRV